MKCVQAGWSHAAHLDEAAKESQRAMYPPYQHEARESGEPSLGVGAIYPIGKADIVAPAMDPPDFWPKVYAMDVGWKRTAAVWAAQDPGSGVLYLYSEHYQGQGEPPSHAVAVKSRGDWMQGVIDPACLGSSQIDGRTLMQIYCDLGLHLHAAANAVEAGITEVWQLLVGGRLKVCENLFNWFAEFQKYHRDEDGKIVKKMDHLLDATRYLCVSGRPLLSVKPKPGRNDGPGVGRSWMA